jgi:hypothetical protein
VQVNLEKLNRASALRRIQDEMQPRAERVVFILADREATVQQFVSLSQDLRSTINNLRLVVVTDAVMEQTKGLCIEAAWPTDNTHSQVDSLVRKP